MIAKRGTELTTNLGEKLVNDWWQMFVSLSGCFGITEVIFENLVPPQFRLRKSGSSFVSGVRVLWSYHYICWRMR
jgi:hypothetical protein